jgi:hypothetical protein
LCGCKVGDLLGFRVLENGGVSVISPTGQKFVYDKILVDGKRKELEEEAKPKPKPRRKAPAARKRAPAKKPAASKAKAKPAVKSSAVSAADEKKH